MSITKSRSQRRAGRLRVPLAVALALMFSAAVIAG
jgi:hypothetical protein